MRYLVLTTVTLFLLPGCYLLRQSDTYYGIDTTGQDVVFVVDVSGSMEGKQEGTVVDQVQGAAARKGSEAVGDAIGGETGRFLGRQLGGEATKLGAAKRELIPAIQGLTAQSRFTVMVFGEDIGGWKSGLLEADGANKNLALAYVKNLSASGGTPALAALEEAFTLEDAQVLFFLSDGRPSDGSPEEILQRVRALNANRGMVIHAIGLGGDQDEVFLRRLAQEHGGKYVKKN